MRFDITLLIRIACSAVVLAAGLSAQPRTLTLEEAVELALRNNHALRAAALRVQERESQTERARADYFPKVSNSSLYFNTVERQRVDIAAGTLGVYPSIGPIPAVPISIQQGGTTNLALATTTVGQPLTQLLKVRQAHRIAQLDTAIASAQLAQARDEVRLNVDRLYYGLLAAQSDKAAAEAELAAVEASMVDAERTVDAGLALQVEALGKRAELLQARQNVLTVDDQVSDLSYSLNALMGLPLETELRLAAPMIEIDSSATLDRYVTQALESNPEVRAAAQLVEKAKRGVKAARTDYIPNVSVFAQHVYQNAVPFLSRNNGVFGLKMDWDIVDFGKRKHNIQARRSAVAQAEENLAALRQQVEVNVAKAYRKVERAEELIKVAREAVLVREEAERIVGNQFKGGLVLTSARTQSGAESARARAKYFAAELNYLISHSELRKLIGSGQAARPAAQVSKQVQAAASASGISADSR